MLCTLDRKIYEDRDSGFSIASFKTKDEAVPSAARSTYYHGDRMIRFTAVGYHLPTTSVIEVDMNGTWENGKYGLQLKVEECTEIIPKTKDGIVAYLSSGLIKGIGEKKAKAIVAALGLDTIEIMEHDPKRLLEIKGITQKKLEMIEESFGKSRAIREIVAYLAPYGVSVKKCSKIRDEFGVNAMDVLKNSPFELCRISGFGFKTVDDIARKTQCRPDDPLRIKGALRFVLDESMLEGHLYLDKETIRAKAHELLNEGYQPNYQIVVDRVNNNDTFEVNVELNPEQFTDTVGGITSLEKSLANAMKTMLGINPAVHLVPPKSIARSEGKAVRVVDKRKLI